MTDSTRSGQEGATTAATEARVRLAARLATELCDLPVAVWRSRSYGASVSERARLDDDLVLAEAVAEAWDLARTRPVPADGMWARTGPAGTAVVVHGRDWSLVAAPGGPVLVLSDLNEQVARLDGDPSTRDELTALVGELIGAAHGEPPFEQNSIPPPPSMPWHRAGRASTAGDHDG